MGLGPPICRQCWEDEQIIAALYSATNCPRCGKDSKEGRYLGGWQISPGVHKTYYPGFPGKEPYPPLEKPIVDQLLSYVDAVRRFVHGEVDARKEALDLYELIDRRMEENSPRHTTFRELRKLLDGSS